MTTDIVKYIGIIITIVGMMIGATLYISNSHADIKSWTLDQDSVKTEQLMKGIEKHYVPKSDFIEVKTDLKHMKSLLERIERKLDNQ
jgi:hypothetical protein